MSNGGGRRARRSRAWPVAAAMLLGACTAGPSAPAPSGELAGSPSGAPSPGTQVGVPDPDAIDAGRLEPLAGLPTCPPRPTDAPDVDLDIDDLPLPDGAVVTRAEQQGDLRSVHGFSPRTPVEILVGYLRLDDWQVIQAEDEVFESEVLLDDGQLRVFAKSQATCARGSAFVLFASREAAQVPEPRGGG